jgi:hypothetical protein
MNTTPNTVEEVVIQVDGLLITHCDKFLSPSLYAIIKNHLVYVDIITSNRIQTLVIPQNKRLSLRNNVIDYFKSISFLNDWNNYE